MEADGLIDLSIQENNLLQKMRRYDLASLCNYKQIRFYTHSFKNMYQPATTMYPAA